MICRQLSRLRLGEPGKLPVISRFFTGFAVRLANRMVSLAGLLGSLPHLWPLMCSLDGNHKDLEKFG